jgi:hypothetical protein
MMCRVLDQAVPGDQSATQSIIKRRLALSRHA